MIRIPIVNRAIAGAALGLLVSFWASPVLATGFPDHRLDADGFRVEAVDDLSPDFLPAEGPDALLAPGSPRPGLLDSRRFSISNSVSYGFSTGSAGNTSAGLWNTGITYRVSDPLSLRADVAVWLNTSGEGSVLAPDHVFLRNLSLDYRLGKSSSIHLSYQAAPAGTGWGFADPFRTFGGTAP